MPTNSEMVATYNREPSEPAIGYPDLETRLADRLSQLVAATPETVDAEIVEAQRDLCRLLGMDRSAIWQGTAQAPDTLGLVYLCTLDEIPPVPQGVTTNGAFPWITRQLLAGKTVAIPDVSALPEEASVDRDSLLYYLDKSTLAIPFADRPGLMRGAISFAATTRHESWPDSVLAQCRLIAQVISSVLSRKRAQQELQMESRLRALLVEIATAYIDMPLEGIAQEIEVSLGKMTDFVEADRGYLFDYDFDKNLVTSTHEWCSEGVTPQIGKNQALPLASVPDRTVASHRRGEPIHEREVERLPVGKLREWSERAGTRSRLTVPLMSDGVCLGFVGFSWNRPHDAHTAGELQLLTVFAHVLVGVRRRQQADQDIALLKHSIDVHPDAAYWLDASGRFIHINEVGCRALGYAPGELLGKSVEVVAPKATPERMQQIWALLREQGAYRAESVHRRKDGSELPVEIISSYIRFGGREYNCGFAHDITERKRAEEEQRQTQLRLNQAQKMEAIGTLAGGIAHDFNNILGAMIGYTDLALMDLPEGSPAQSMLENVQRGGARAVDLVRQILTFSRQTKHERKALQPALVVKEALKLLRASLPATIAVDSRCESAAWVLADAGQIHQIVMNLCTNAGLAMKDHGGTLEVHLREHEMDAGLLDRYPELAPGRYVCLTVKDTGCGIPLEILGRIFEPFFTTRPADQGTGLGLSVVHGIVKTWGGAIGVDSEVGIGTTFEVLLPICEATAKPESERTQHERGHERVLFIDDEVALTEVASKGLTRFGYSVVAFNDPAQALAAFRASPKDFDIVITDMTMPGLTGELVAAEVRRLRPEIPVVLVSGFSDRLTAEQALAAGFDGFVDKPLRPTTLAQLIRRLCDRR